MTDKRANLVYENEYCEVIWSGDSRCHYILRSKSDKYPEQHCLDLIEVSRMTNIPVHELATYNEVTQ